MRSKLLHQSAGQRIYALVLETGDEAMTCLQDFANKEEISAAQITGIGALSDATLNYFDWERKKYLPIPVREQVEVASLIGDVALSPSGKPAIHVHVVLGRRDGSALAGHLAQAYVRPTLELILSEPPTYLQKVARPAERACSDPAVMSASIAGSENRAPFHFEGRSACIAE